MSILVIWECSRSLGAPSSSLTMGEVEGTNVSALHCWDVAFWGIRPSRWWLTFFFFTSRIYRDLFVVVVAEETVIFVSENMAPSLLMYCVPQRWLFLDSGVPCIRTVYVHVLAQQSDSSLEDDDVYAPFWTLILEGKKSNWVVYQISHVLKWDVVLIVLFVHCWVVL
jgi:hypothetical protein